MRPLPLRELLGILVADLIVAEAQAANASAGFLKEAGFIGGKEASDDWGKLRFVSFSFPVQDPDGKAIRTIKVPLLSLLPIPLQQIDQAEFELFVKVHDVKEIEVQANEKNKLGSATHGLEQQFLDLICEVAPYSPESSTDKKGAFPKVHIKLTMRQADLPAGLSSSLRRIEQASSNKTE